MPPKRTVTLAELKAMRMKDAAPEPPERVEVPTSLKWVGGLVLFITSFFASALVVIAGYQLFGIAESDTAKTIGTALIIGLGLLFFAGGLLLLMTRSHLASQWLARRLVELGIGTDAKKSPRTKSR